MFIELAAMLAASPDVRGVRVGNTVAVWQAGGTTTHFEPVTPHDREPLLMDSDGEHMNTSFLFDYGNGDDLMSAVREGYMDDDDEEEVPYIRNYLEQCGAAGYDTEGNPVGVDQLSGVGDLLRSALIHPSHMAIVVKHDGFIHAHNSAQVVVVSTTPVVAGSTGAVMVGDAAFSPTGFTNHSLSIGETVGVCRGSVVLIGHGGVSITESHYTSQVGRVVGGQWPVARELSRGECSGYLLVMAAGYKSIKERAQQSAVSLGRYMSPEEILQLRDALPSVGNSAFAALERLGVSIPYSIHSTSSSAIRGAANHVVEDVLRGAAVGRGFYTRAITSMLLSRMAMAMEAESSNNSTGTEDVVMSPQRRSDPDPVRFLSEWAVTSTIPSPYPR